MLRAVCAARTLHARCMHAARTLQVLWANLPIQRGKERLMFARATVAAEEAMRLLYDADFAESNHFFKASRLFLAQAAQQSADAAEETRARRKIP